MNEYYTFFCQNVLNLMIPDIWGCDSVSLGRLFQTCWRITVPSSWRVKQSKMQLNSITVQQDATVFSLLCFCRQLYMFRVLTPVIRSSYNCSYSFWHWSTRSTTICSHCWVGVGGEVQNEFFYRLITPWRCRLHDLLIIGNHVVRRHLVVEVLTLLRYHEKSYVNSTMGSIWPHFKKNRIRAQFITKIFFSK